MLVPNCIFLVVTLSELILSLNRISIQRSKLICDNAYKYLKYVENSSFCLRSEIRRFRKPCYCAVIRQGCLTEHFLVHPITPFSPLSSRFSSWFLNFQSIEFSIFWILGFRLEILALGLLMFTFLLNNPNPESRGTVRVMTIIDVLLTAFELVQAYWQASELVECSMADAM